MIQSSILKENNDSYQNSFRDNDWSAVSTTVKSTSPNDQLVAAILDGDVQGIRTIVRSRGDSLLSEYWRDLALSVLPLHRAISGLHFHGSDRMLINTIDTLVQLGAAIDAQDQAGNTVLHKAIQVCTSTSVVAVVECILRKGASPSIRNYIGQCPIHVECSRVRTASTKVISLLLKAGVDPNVLTKANKSRGQESTGRGSITQNVSPLYLVLQRAMSLANVHNAEDISVADQNVMPHSSTLHNISSNMDDSIASVVNATGSAYPSKMRVSGLRVWVKVVYTLVEAGAEWNSSMISTPGHTQLYMFLCAFPPPPTDVELYKKLLRGALSVPGMNPLLEDELGRSALFVLCERMAITPEEMCPAAPQILSLILQHIPNGGIGGSDRSGRTIFDLEDLSMGHMNQESCLQASRQLLIDAVTGADTAVRRWSRNSTNGNVSNSHSSQMLYHPPNDSQMRHSQRTIMQADKYVVNGIEQIHQRRF